MDNLNKNLCPLCKTELPDSNLESVWQEFDVYKKIEEENKALRDKIEELESQLKVKNKFEHSEHQYNDVADEEEIQELLSHLKHPLVIAAIINIISNNSQQASSDLITENQNDLIPDNLSQSCINNSSDEIAVDEAGNNSQEYSDIKLDRYLTPEERQLIDDYKNLRFNLHQSIINVSEPEESQTKRWSGSEDKTIFKKNIQGNYWIAYTDYSLYYIVPQMKFKINEYSKDTLISAFDCRNYHPGITNDFTLVKPGKVERINEDEWQLTERGILQF